MTEGSHMASTDAARRINTGLGLAAIALWGTTVAFGRSLTEQVGLLTAAFFIYAIGGGLGSVYLAASGRLRPVFRLDRRYLVGCGLLFIVYTVAFYAAVGGASGRSQVIEVGLINYLWPTLTVVFTVVLLRLRASVLLVPGVIVATLGVFLALTQDEALTFGSFVENLSADAFPYAMALVAAVSWGLYSALSRKWGEGGESEAVPVFMLATALVLGIGMLVFPEESTWSARALGELAFLAIGPNLAYVFWEMATRRGDIAIVASASYFTPLLSTFVSVLYLDVPAGARLWIGCALVIAGAVACQRSMRGPGRATS